MRAVQSFHANKARRDIRKERRYCFATQRLSDDGLPVLINAVDLEDVFGQIQTNTSDLHNIPPSMQLNFEIATRRTRAGAIPLAPGLQGFYCVLAWSLAVMCPAF